MSRIREVKEKEVSDDKVGGAPPDKIRRCDPNHCSDHSGMLISCGNDPQDADYVELPRFSDELEFTISPKIPIELETIILARVGILEFRKLCLLNKRFLSLVKNGDLLRERRMIGIKEACAFVFASGEQNWLAFDHNFTSHKVLPALPSEDIMFKSCDKESLSVGTHLLVCGTDMNGPVIWTYDVIMNRWFKGSSMVQPRCLFASASCGDFAFVAGGLRLEVGGLTNSSEKYDPQTKSWISLPAMKVSRKLCAGFIMDKKFYVIGGLTYTEQPLTCGEVFDKDQNKWEYIPDMLNGLALAAPPTEYQNMELIGCQSPPLVAVVNNELYLFKATTNLLLVYQKKSNSWKELGPVPVRADINKGWGVAFKSLGDQLLVIGGSNMSSSGRGRDIYSCFPNPNANSLNWKRVLVTSNKSHFVQNCTVMLV